MADVSNITNFLGDVANAIRNKKNSTDSISPKDFDTEILGLDTSNVNTFTANATESDIVMGKTAYVKGEEIHGNIRDERGTEDAIHILQLNDNKTVTYNSVGNGHGGYITVEANPSDLIVVNNNTTISVEVLGKFIADAIGLKPEQIVAGNTILGVEGTYEK